jgi:hypothetical protein
MRSSLNETHTLTESYDKSEFYVIRLKGYLHPRWAGWFEGLTITLQASGDTLLTGPLADQAALHGLLKKVRDLGMTLISVNLLEPGPVDEPDRKT